jgi:peptidyl-tRNA hydrolase
MSPGKLCAQAGHAYVGALQAAQSIPAGRAYVQESPGTKVALQATLPQMQRAELALESAGVPFFLVVDSGHMNFFKGEPTVTALGFGPLKESEVPNIITKLRLL